MRDPDWFDDFAGFVMDVGRRAAESAVASALNEIDEVAQEIQHRTARAKGRLRKQRKPNER